MNQDERERYVLVTINKMIQTCHAFTLDEFNFKTAQINHLLVKAEEQDDRIGVATLNDGQYGISTLSIIATITACLTGKRLGFIIDDENIVDGVEWVGNGQEVVDEDDTV